MRNFSRGVVPVALTITLLAFSCKKSGPTQPQQTQSSAPQAMPVQGLIASGRELSADIRVPGTILPYESTEIHPEVAGRIVELNLRDGGYVKKGALIARLYDGDLKAQLHKLEVQLEIAEQTEQRQGQLLSIQGISQQDYDLSLLQVKTLKADIDIVHEQILKTEIRAPFSGKLGLKMVSPGAYVTPSTIFTTISEVDRLKIQFSVPERYGAKMTGGLQVSFTIDGVDKTFAANVIATEVQIDETTRSLAVRAEIKDHDRALIPGAFAEVQIVLGRSNDALMIPNLVVIPQGRKKLIYLYKGGKAVPTEIQTGVRDSVDIEVVSGLKPGDTIITSSLLFMRPGLDVHVAGIGPGDSSISQ